MCRVSVVKKELLTRAGRYKEETPEIKRSHVSSPQKVKQVLHEGKRYVICFNTKQTGKDAAEREGIRKWLEDKLKAGAKTLVGNKGYRKYLKIAKSTVRIDQEKIREERYDGKWMLTTNMDMSPEKIALKYKEVFCQVKSILETKPVYQ